jgi:hypothetical protein
VGGRKAIEMAGPEEWKAQVTEVGIPAGITDQMVSWCKEADREPITIYSSQRFREKKALTVEYLLQISMVDF